MHRKLWMCRRAGVLEFDASAFDGRCQRCNLLFDKAGKRGKPEVSATADDWLSMKESGIVKFSVGLDSKLWRNKHASSVAGVMRDRASCPRPSGISCLFPQIKLVRQEEA